MDSFETDLAKLLRAAATAPPTKIDPEDIVRAGGGRRVPKFATPVLAASVVAAIALAMVLLDHAGHQASSPAAIAPSPRFTHSGSGGLTDEQHKLATDIAISVGRSSLQTSTPPSPLPTDASGWPSNVDEASAIVTTHADAMQYVGAAADNDQTTVLVIRLVGDFSWITPGPSGHGPITGNVITIVANAQSGKTLDSGIERQQPPPLLPGATVLFDR
jgi:hypothetical protein